MPNLHQNLHPNVESSMQRSLLQLVRPSLWLMGSMCSCSGLCGTGKRSLTLSLFSSRGMQQTDGLMHCIENFASLHHLHGTIRSLYVSVYFRALGDVQQLIGHKFCVVCGGNAAVISLLAMVSIPRGGGVTWQRSPPGVGGNCCPSGGGEVHSRTLTQY